MSIFLSQKEIDFFNSITEEGIDVVSHTFILYKVDEENSQIDNIYSESTKKAFLPGIQIKALINFLEPEISSTPRGTTQKRRIEAYIHKKYLEDRSIHFTEGDYIYWDNQYFEIVNITEPQLIQNLPGRSHEIRIECTSAEESEINIIERPK